LCPEPRDGPQPPPRPTQLAVDPVADVVLERVDVTRAAYAVGVATSAGTDRIRIGVVLARQPDDLAEWLIDAAAFDAGGAEVLWTDLRAASDLDPVVVTAALAAVTGRALIVANLPGGDGPPARAVALDTIARLSRGRLRVAEENAGVHREGVARFSPVPDEPGAFDEVDEVNSGRRWVATSFPVSRAAWRSTLLEAAERGVHGLLVPADPRLLDLLRNPDDDVDRRDLQIAQG
jgi:hypothetical protein